MEANFELDQEYTTGDIEGSSKEVFSREVILPAGTTSRTAIPSLIRPRDEAGRRARSGVRQTE